MQQLTVKPACLNGCPWARPARTGYGVVLAVCEPLPDGLAPWLRGQGWRLQEYAKDQGQAMVWLVGGNPNDLLAWLPRPPSHGSMTPGVLLPF